MDLVSKAEGKEDTILLDEERTISAFKIEGGELKERRSILEENHQNNRVESFQADKKDIREEGENEKQIRLESEKQERKRKKYMLRGAVVGGCLSALLMAYIFEDFLINNREDGIAVFFVGCFVGVVAGIFFGDIFAEYN